MISKPKESGSRRAYRLLTGNGFVEEPKEDNLDKAAVFSFFVGLIIFILTILLSCSNVFAYSNHEIVKAIYRIEGGKNAKYPYGIRSVRVSSKQEAYQVCLNTVRNNKARFKKAKNNSYKDYIAFLASRYCPIGSRTWEKNLRSVLKQNRRLNKGA